MAILSAIALGAACELAQAQPNHPGAGDAATAPPYTLEVDSDAPDVVSFEALAARIGSDLGAGVVRPGAALPSRAAITIRYRDRQLVVRVVHPGGRVLERSVKAEGDDAAVQREAVLLAGNLARDEARELLDVLSARPEAPAPAAAAAAPAKPAAAPVDEGYHPVSVALFYPLATNYARPNVRSNVNFGLVYGRVGTIAGMQLGGAIDHASRGVDGVQLAGAGAGSGGPVSGAQISGAGNLALGEVGGAQVAGAVNLALKGMSGAQLGGAANVARGDASGLQVAGAVNLALKGMSGAQLGGAVNVARGDSSGLQLAGAANIATRDFDGAQLGGAVNVAGSVTGAQIGVINIARKVSGAQIGVVNIAEEVDGVAIGAVSISKNSIHPVVWASNLQYMNAGVKFTTKYVYTILGVHYGTLEDDFDNFGTTAALGGHIPLPAGFDVEVQGSVTHLVPWITRTSEDGNLWVAPQAIAGYSFAPHLRVFAGGGARIPAIVNHGRDVVRPEVLVGVQF